MSTDKHTGPSIKIKSFQSSPGFNSLKQRIMELENTVLSQYDRLNHELFYVKCGQVKEEYKSILNEVNDDKSEVIIEHMEWPIDDKYFNYVSERWLQTFFETEVELSELRESIQNVSNQTTDVFNETPDGSNETPDGSLEELITSASTLWEELGISQEQAKKYTLALNFYTGFSSECSNQLLLSEINHAFIGSLDSAIIRKEYHLINSYIIKALITLPSYWGYCNRCCNVNESNLIDYVPGNSVVWIRFSSSKLGLKPANFAMNRNTQFVIYSLTGKHIKSFSKFKAEDEILFMPYTQFLVCKRVQENNKVIIYLRQIELGIGIKNILWVDDRIFEPNWENKSHMDTVVRRNKEIKFIPKSSTQTAIAYLKSIWGKKFLNDKQSQLRIVTDMNRPNEDNPNEAGAVFIKMARELGFLVPIMIFTSSLSYAKKTVKKHQIDSSNILITASEKLAIQFMMS
ncbi:hypothetical protein SteCoe_3822 [Stentor coeruleus]|uniref:NAD(P)(+)--arginine ADP-ribosyltransferase n=1 Tax=Stentor coeruleus TaxID=5963 RepID=A0A1R2CW58_9CILI|nr:hypothetical protein SteCoe_3822 [Stentor coeruleus]